MGDIKEKGEDSSPPKKITFGLLKSIGLFFDESVWNCVLSSVGYARLDTFHSILLFSIVYLLFELHNGLLVEIMDPV